MKEVINNSINSSWDQIGELRQQLDNDPSYQAAFPKKGGHIFRRDTQENNSQQSYIIEGNGKEFYVPSGSPLENIVANIFASLEKPNAPSSMPSPTQPESSPKRSWVKRLGDGLNNIAQRIIGPDENVPRPHTNTSPNTPTSVSRLPEQGAPLSKGALDAIHHRLDNIEKLIQSMCGPRGYGFFPSNSPVPVSPDLNIYQMFSDLQNRLLHLENLLNNSPDRNSNFPNFPSPPASPRGHSRHASRHNELTPASSPRSTTTSEHIENLFSAIPAIQQNSQGRSATSTTSEQQNTPEQPFPHIPTAQSHQQSNTDTSSFPPAVPSSRQQGSCTTPPTTRPKPGNLTITVPSRPQERPAPPDTELDLEARFARLADRPLQTEEEQALRNELTQLRANHRTQLEDAHNLHQAEVRELNNEIERLSNSLQDLNSQLESQAKDSETERTELQAQIDSTTRQLLETRFALEDMKAAHQGQVDYLRTQQKLTMQELQNQLEAIAQQLQLSDQQVAHLLKQIDTLKQQHQQDLQKLKTEASQQRQEALENQEKELNVQFQAHLQTLLQQLQDAQRTAQAERDRIQAFDILKAQNELLASQNAQLQSALEQEQQLKNKAQIAQAALQTRINQLQNDHADDINKLNQRHGQRIAALKRKLTAQHKQELEGLTQQLLDLQNATRTQLEKARANVEAAKEDLRRVQEQLNEANDLNRKLQSALEQEQQLKNNAQIAQAALQTRIKQLQNDHAKAINELKHQHGQRIAALKRKLTAQHKQELEGLTQQLRDLQNATRTQLEKARANVEAAKEDLRRVQEKLNEANDLNRELQLALAHEQQLKNNAQIAQAALQTRINQLQNDHADAINKLNQRHGKHIEDLRKSLTIKHKQELDALTQQLRDLENATRTQLEKARANVEAANENLRRVQGQLAQATELNDTQRIEIGRLNAQLQANEVAAAAAQKENQGLQQKNNELLAKLKSLKQELRTAFKNGEMEATKRFEQKIQEMNNALAEAARKIESLQQSNSALTAEGDELKEMLQQYQDIQARAQEAEARNSSLQEQLAEFTHQKIDFERQKLALETRVKSYTKDLETTRKELESSREKLDKEIQSNGARVTYLKNQITDRNSKIKELEASLHGATTDLDVTTSRLINATQLNNKIFESAKLAEEQQQAVEEHLQALSKTLNFIVAKREGRELSNENLLVDVELLEKINDILQSQDHLIAEQQRGYDDLLAENEELHRKFQHELSHTRHPSVIFEPVPASAAVHDRSFSMDETALQTYANGIYRQNDERASASALPVKRRTKSVGGFLDSDSDDDESSWSLERDGRSGSSDRDSRSGSSTSSTGSMVYTGP